MSRFYYNDGMRVWLNNILATSTKKITVSDIRQMAKEFNYHFKSEQKDTAIGAQLRLMKTDGKYPVKIEWHLKRESIRMGKFPTILLNKDEQKPHIDNPCQKVKHLIKALNDGVVALVEENVRLKQEMRRMAGIRAAVEQYQKIG